MRRISAKSNPTGLIELESRQVQFSIDIREGREYFRLEDLKLVQTAKLQGCEVVAIVRAGQTFNRLELGPIDAFTRTPLPLFNLDPSSVRRVRILLHPRGVPRLTASAEGLFLRGASERESLLPMLPADLGQMVWRLVEEDEAQFVIAYNNRIFPSIDGLISYSPFVAMVLPEALRQVLLAFVKANATGDEGSPWAPWESWLGSIGVETLPADADTDDDQVVRKWVEDAVQQFCEQHQLGSRLAEYLEDK